MRKLSDSQINDLHEALVQCGLVGSVDALLGGIDRALVASLPGDVRPDARLLRVLHELDELGQLPDGSVPLEVFLQNAAMLTRSRQEKVVLRSALTALDLPNRSTSSWRGDASRHGETALSRPEGDIRLRRRWRVPVGIALVLATITFGLVMSRDRLFAQPAAASDASPAPTRTEPPPIRSNPIEDTSPPEGPRVAPTASAPVAISRPSTSPNPSAKPKSSSVQVAPDGFDRSAAERALGAASNSAKHRCAMSGGPSGGVSIKVTFDPQGSVKSASVGNPPIGGTVVGRCIEALFMRIVIKPYPGADVTVPFSFTLPLPE